jgi:hypothetical protein
MFFQAAIPFPLAPAGFIPGRIQDLNLTLPGNSQSLRFSAPTLPTVLSLYLESFTGFFSANVSPFPLYAQLFATNIAIIPGASPLVTLPLQGLSQSFSYSIPIAFQPGILIAVSTSPNTWVAALAGDILRYSLTFTR